MRSLRGGSGSGHVVSALVQRAVGIVARTDPCQIERRQRLVVDGNCVAEADHHTAVVEHEAAEHVVAPEQRRRPLHQRNGRDVGVSPDERVKVMPWVQVVPPVDRVLRRQRGHTPSTHVERDDLLTRLKQPGRIVRDVKLCSRQLATEQATDDEGCRGRQRCR